MKTVALTVLLLAIQTVEGAPRVAFPESSFSFGKVLAGESLQHDFVLRNDGTEPLRILSVNLTNGLQLAKTPAVIAPGTQTLLRVQLRASEATGLFEGELRLELNDPDSPAHVLRVSAEVTPLVEILPRPTLFVVSQRGQGAKESVEIVNHATEPLEIRGVEHSHERFTSALETIEKGKRYRLTVEIRPDGPAGRKTEFLILHTSSRQSPEVSVLVGTFLREKVYTFPEIIDFGTPPNSALLTGNAPGLTQTLMVYRLGMTGFEVRASSSNPLLLLSAVVGPQGDRYQITVRLSPAATIGPIDGAITLETNDPEFPILKVPITGRISAP